MVRSFCVSVCDKTAIDFSPPATIWSPVGFFTRREQRLVTHTTRAGVGCVQGCPLPTGDKILRGAVPLPVKFCDYCSKMVHFCAFWVALLI